MVACVVVIPVLRRPHRVEPLLASLEASEADARPLFVCSPGDTAEQDAIATTGADLIVIDREPGPGDFARKINTGFHATSTEFVFVAADDLDFRPGWLTAALTVAGDTLGVVGTNDLGNRRVMRGEHATHLLVRRAYIDEHGTIDEPGKVLHEGYHHNFCDDELVGTAKSRGAWGFAHDSIVEHLHPHWGKSEDDEVYQLGQAHFRVDQKLYRRRRVKWEG